MSYLHQIETTCPACFESVSLMVDVTAGDQRYIEDCQVCCRPMEVQVWVSPDGEVSLEVSG